MTGVSGLAGDPAYPVHEPPMPPLPLGKSGTKIAQTMNQLGWHWWPSGSDGSEETAALYCDASLVPLGANACRRPSLVPLHSDFNSLNLGRPFWLQ